MKSYFLPSLLSCLPALIASSPALSDDDHSTVGGKVQAVTQTQDGRRAVGVSANYTYDWKVPSSKMDAGHFEATIGNSGNRLVGGAEVNGTWNLHNEDTTGGYAGFKAGGTDRISEVVKAQLGAAWKNEPATLRSA